ncbi:hypothetical protein [Nitrosomonas sp. Nm51]|uniref:hypothetical protein n=1 Tax=Nitrosomonas sp. Nm51 TaxID=133720 RepID=UPI00115F8119|nr:hypothetical protein [Nitrosomonas sp. Nm51]
MKIQSDMTTFKQNYRKQNSSCKYREVLIEDFRINSVRGGVCQSLTPVPYQYDIAWYKRYRGVMRQGAARRKGLLSFQVL